MRFQYETNSDEVRRQFEEHGEIKTFFDLIANRGMVFVTFVSVRCIFSPELDDLAGMAVRFTCCRKSTGTVAGFGD
jgi:hypothetical protein